MAITISVDPVIVNAETASLVSSSITPVTNDTQLFICVGIDDTTEGDISTIADSDGGTITQIADFLNANQRVRLYCIASPSLVARTITVTMTAATDCSIKVFTVKGSVTDTDPSDVTANNNATDGSVTVSITPNDTTKGMIILLVEQISNSVYSALGTGQVERGMFAQGGQEKNSGLYTSEIYTSAPGAQTATASKSAHWIGLAVEIKEAAGQAFEVTATTVLTHSSVNPVIKEASRTVADAQVQSDSVSLAGSTYNRTGATVLVHSSVNPVIKEASRTVAQTLTHIDSALAAFGKSVTAITVLVHSSVNPVIKEASRVVAQAITHSESIAKLTERFVTATTVLLHSESIAIATGVSVSAVQTITHSDAVAVIKEASRTVSQTLTHSESIANLREYIRTVADALIHSSSVVIEVTAGNFERVVSQILTHLDSVVIETTGAAPPVVKIRPPVSARKPLQPPAPEIIQERLTVFFQVTLFEKQLTSTQTTNTIGLKLYQRESITTRLLSPDKWLVKDHTSNTIKLVLKKNERLITTLRLKLRESKTRSQVARLSIKQEKEYQSIIRLLATKDKALAEQLAFIKTLKERNDNLEGFVKTMQTALEELTKNTMVAEDIIALFSATD